MISCPACSTQIPDKSRFCSACGTVMPNGDAADATVAMATEVMIPATPPTRPPSASSSPHSSRTRFPGTSASSARFAPGTMIVGRYQIIELLGKGGMGEVYSANDLTLDQEVALKFLPSSMASHPAMLARFHSEVRIARQVSQPNVCRVYDIGEVEGSLFLSMEYVDGEDLSSLLRRIGRLPTDKALEFTRKLCAGLAAAHEKGVIHRDLKPANIMIDSQGQVVIMDFGLAGVAEQMVGAEIGAGTPAYMAPEQLAGREVSLKSDIYALGLVLYEMFTGRRPYDGKSAAEQRQLQEQSLPASLTTVVKDIDPAIERVILRCLAPDPRSRPASALAVAAALPGGDPLAVALAAGETPSPDMVAASGSTVGLKPWIAFSLAGFVAVSLVAITVMAPMVQHLSIAAPELPPDALTQKAREFAASFGYPQKAVGWARSYAYDQDAIRHIERNLPAAQKWTAIAQGQPDTLYFWYRQSPRYLEPYSGGVSTEDPPETVSGMYRVTLTPRGLLKAFVAVPPQVDDLKPPDTAVAWDIPLRAAGIDPAQVKLTAPQWTPPVMADARIAWTARAPESPKTDLRIEAAAWRGRPVYFSIIGPWSRPGRMQPFQPSLANTVAQLFITGLAMATLIAATLMSRYNVKRGRGNLPGATRLAIFSGTVFFSIWLLNGWHVASAREVRYMWENIGMALLIATSSWVGYVAVEPFVRRHWPQTIVSWTRLLNGHVKDPLVGRDLLIGIAVGCFWCILWTVSMLIPQPSGVMPTWTALSPLLGARQTMTLALASFSNVLLQLLVMFFLLFVIRAVVRREWLTAAVYILFTGALQLLGSATPLVDLGFAVLVSASIYLVLTRGGFTTFFAALYVNFFVVQMPLTNDFSSWYAHCTVFMLMLLGGLAAYATYSALAGTSLIRDELL